jgi:ferritin
MKSKIYNAFFAGVTAFATVPAAATAAADTLTARAELDANRIPDELVDAFNAQISHELDGAHFYLAISNFFYLKNLDGFGHWFGQQYYEELNHARIMMDYLKKKNVRVVLTAVVAPDALKAEEAGAIFDQSLKVEEVQTNRIHELHDKALALKAADAASFLQWFIDEQVQEEDHFQNIFDRIALVRNSLEGILLIDKELALRPAAVVWNPGQPLPPH